LKKASKPGCAKQLQHEVKVGSGINLKYGQSQRIISEKQGDSKDNCIKQLRLLTSLINKMRESDPHGTYLLESRPCTYLEEELEFRPLYISWGATKNFWKHSRYTQVFS